MANRSTAPLEPDAGAVERRYGDFAELYAKTRAQAAGRMGRRSSALKWIAVQNAIEQQDGD